MIKEKLVAVWFILIASTVSVGAAELNHGQSFKISGTGFGSRNVVTSIFDDASNSSVSTIWNDASGVSYSEPSALGRNVPLPHDNITKYAVGNLTSHWWSGLSTHVTGITFPTNMFIMAYRRIDPKWAFGSECNTGTANDNNFKYLAVSAGTSYFDSPYWYHDQTNQKCSYNGSWGNSFYSSGGLGSLNTAWTGNQGGSSDSNYDYWHGWRKAEYRIGLGSSGQILKYLTNNKYYQNLKGMNTFGAGGSDGAFSIGVYARQYGKASQYHYLADIVLVIGPDAFKRVILANSSTYNLATIVEYQPISSWTNSSVQITGNVGAIPDGTAYLHVFIDSSDTPISTIPVTVGGGNHTTINPPKNVRIVDQN